MKRILAFLYGIVAYAIFLGVFLYLIAFVGNLGVPKSIDVGATSGTGAAVVVNLLLIAMFGAQHSIMARPWFKRRIVRFVPAAIERSTFVLVASLVLALTMALWQPIPVTLWQASGATAALAWAGFAAGWAIVLLSTFMIDHFDLFGLRQTWLHLVRRPWSAPAFRTTLLYRLVRHPIMVGFLIAFWCTPHMTVGHLLFAAGMTVYILVGVQHEERDLVDALGADYVAYRRVTPAFVPGLGGAASDLPARPEAPPRVAH